MVEPTACAVHARHWRAVEPGATWSPCSAPARSACCAIAATPQHAAPQASIIAAAKHPQQRALAAELGADLVVEPAELRAGRASRAPGSLADGAPAHRRRRRRHRLRRQRATSIAAGARRSSGPGGARRRWSACPATVKLDLTALWHREIEARRRLRLRHRDAGRRRAARAPSTSPSTSCATADLGRLVIGHLPAVALPATPSPTPPPPAGAAP